MYCIVDWAWSAGRSDALSPQSQYIAILPNESDLQGVRASTLAPHKAVNTQVGSLKILTRRGRFSMIPYRLEALLSARPGPARLRATRLTCDEVDG